MCVHGTSVLPLRPIHNHDVSASPPPSLPSADVVRVTRSRTAKPGPRAAFFPQLADLRMDMWIEVSELDLRELLCLLGFSELPPSPPADEWNMCMPSCPH
jgi:hypothetical protein